MAGTAPLFQIEITRNDAAVTNIAEAATALDNLGIEFDAIEVEDKDAGIWLVGLLGSHAVEAEAGVSVTEADGTYEIYVPQP